MPPLLKQEGIDYVKLHKVLHDDGFHVLAYDMRNHGESEKKLPSGWGIVEYRDAAGALDWVNAHATLKNCDVALLPFCVNGQATLKANTIYPEKFKNVKAWVFTNLFSLTNMIYEGPMFHALFMKGGGSMQAVCKQTVDEALAEKHAGYIAKGLIKEHPHVQFCSDQLCATTYTPNVAVPVLYCTPTGDFVANQAVDAPAIFASFPNPKSEFHPIGTTEPEPFKTTNNNRSQGYNFYQSEAGSKVMLEFLHKQGL